MCDLVTALELFLRSAFALRSLGLKGKADDEMELKEEHLSCLEVPLLSCLLLEAQASVNVSVAVNWNIPS